jgi:F-type H+-transporting ATPase subunit beta
MIDRFGAPLDGGEPLAGLDLSAATDEAAPGSEVRAPWTTGIKVIDFYAPMALGTTVALQAQASVGMFVTVNELIHRLAEQRGGCAVFTKLDAQRNELREMIGQLRESGVERRTLLVAGEAESGSAELRRVIVTAIAVAETLAAEGRDVLLVLEDGFLTPETIDLLRGRARLTSTGSITLLLCFWRHAEAEPTPEILALIDGADVRLVFSRELAAQAIWPAIDAIKSRSRMLETGQLGEKQRRSVAAARELLQAGEQVTSELERERGRKLLLFQAQPFFVAEPFTARPAEYVTPEESLDTFEAIVAGGYDRTPAEALRFVGRAPLPAPAG